MARRPTPRQAELLAEIADGDIMSRRIEGGWFSARRDPSFANVNARAETVIRDGWAEATNPAGKHRVLQLTDTGRVVLEEAQLLAEVEALPVELLAEWFGLVRVVRRRRGNSPIRGGGKVPDGREVRCTPCYRAARAAGSRVQDPVVWYTNEGGRDADHAAEVARAAHVLRHVHGELPTPTPDTTETTP